MLERLITEFFKKLDFGGKIVSVTRIETAESLKMTEIFISIYPEGGEKKIMKMLDERTGEARKYVSDKVSWRFVPEIRFKLDMGDKARQRIEDILKKI